MAESYRGLETLHARFTQVKSYPQLDLTDPPEKGFVVADLRDSNERKIRLEIETREKRVLVVTGGRYLLYQPKINQAIEGKVESGRAGGAGFVSFLTGDLSRAHQDYDVSSLDDEPVDGRLTKHLRLRLKKGSQAYYRRIDLWVDTDLWLPVRQVLVEPNQSVIRFRVEDIRRNLSLDDKLFDLDLPSDVKRIRG
jgi:outer membrane lipoprotein-sorting protein